MTYNAVRIVKKIKQKVELTSAEEFETGLRAALGLSLTYTIQNRLQQYHIADTFQLALFENSAINLKIYLNRQVIIYIFILKKNSRLKNYLIFI